MTASAKPRAAETRMAADKPRPTLADYVTIALSPALIVAMISSLVFFLVAILYRGDFAGRLQHILFFFVFGMVLVARISMETGIAERAPLYGAVLAFLVWLGMGKFVDYPPGLGASSWLINAGLVALAWWLAYKLTYSCTWIDEQAEATGTGVLQAAGLEGEPRAPSGASGDASAPAPRGKTASNATWRERYERFREEQRTKQTPGVWVVYFALAALPIYGLGQALIPPEDAERRGYTFWLMTLYAASSLGLLVTTSFLGLRHYLRQRKLQMPAAITAAWLALGGGLLLAFVLIAALLPRPQAEFSILNLTPAGSKPRDASRFAATRGDPGQGEGRTGAQQRDPEGDPVASKDKDREGAGGKGQAKGVGKGEKGEAKGGAKDTGKASENKGAPAKQEGDDSRQASGESKAGQPPAQGNEPARRSWLPDQPWLANLATALKWIVFAVVAIVTIIVVLRGGLRYLANFCDWARRLLEAFRRFWEGLFGVPSPAPPPPGDVEQQRRARRPFDAFANPFLDGRADGMLPADLVRYSFEALEAWAQQRGWGRGAEETPIEFSERLAATEPELAAAVRRLGSLYARVLYARGALPASWRAALEQFWEQLDLAPAR